MSCDYDFIALAAHNSVDALIDPTHRMIIFKREILEFLEIDSKALRIAYCVGGCDDIQTKLSGIGFKKALSFSKKYPLTIQSFNEVFEKYQENDLELLLAEIKNLEVLIDESFPIVLDQLQADTHTSMVSSFVSALDAEGLLKRPGLYALYTAKV